MIQPQLLRRGRCGGMTEPDEAIEIPLFLRGAEETTVLFANHFLIQEYQGVDTG